MGSACCCCSPAALAFGGWRSLSRQNAGRGDRRAARDFVPTLRVASGAGQRRDDRDGHACRPRPQPSPPPISSPAPAAISTSATSISAIASRQGELLAEITAPELDHQIAQAEATLAQIQATLQQTQANRDLAQVTWERDSHLVKKGWVTLQQGDIDRQTLQAQQAAVGVAQSNVAAQRGAASRAQQQKAYQRVVAPFDGVITQRNIDVGSLVQADATSGTFMFTIMQSNVIRTQVYVPQDQAFGVAPGRRGGGARARDSGSHFPGQGDAHRRRAAARHADAADRDRRAQSRRRADARDLLHGRAAYPAQDAQSSWCRPMPSSSTRDGCRSPSSRTASSTSAKSRWRATSATRSRCATASRQGDQVILNPPVDLVEGNKVHIRLSDTKA